MRAANDGFLASILFLKRLVGTADREGHLVVLTCKHDFEEQLLLLRRFLVNVGVVALTSLIPESRQCQRSSELLKKYIILYPADHLSARWSLSAKTLLSKL